ncbi:S53 family peptidase [Acidicapsa ligni]|uniref:S53 family peptidase n=1 Tax=Acidicapsa ligni TaxID=542300 RepID=UPI0021E05D6D|nr:S53 family serine peptidase [Acidicapsa ligni]
MKVFLLAATALILGVFTTTGLAQTSHVSTTLHVQTLGVADQNAITHFTVFLPLTHQETLQQLLQNLTDTSSPQYHHWLTPAQFKTQFGPSASTIAQAKAALQSAGFKVIGEKTQSLEVEGSVSAVQRTFSTHLQRVQTARGGVKLTAVERHLTLPSTLASLGAVIPAFSSRLEARTHSRRMAKSLAYLDPLFRLTSNDSFFYPNDLNEAYRLPSFQAETTLARTGHRAPLAGVGTHIGIVISSVISPSDLAATFNSTLNLGGGINLVQAYSANTKLPVPTLTVVPVDGGSGPFNPASDDALEASLDTQMSLGTAPGATETLYNIPDLSDDSILDGYATVDEDNVVDIVSSSFGGCERYYTAAYNGGVDFTNILQVYHSLFDQGNAQGITFIASTGDNGGVPCLSPEFLNNPSNGTSFVAGVETPAADPDVTAVGGTNLSTSAAPGADDATYKSENADFDPVVPAEYQIGPTTIVSVGNNTWGSGGGISSVFPKPWYQKLVPTGSKQYRTTPDLALMMGGCPGDADLAAQDCTALPRSSALIWIGGELDLVIGTSAAAPEFAGALALAVEINNGRLGNVNPEIYGLAAVQNLLGGAKAPAAFQFYHRNISGSNNFFTVTPGQAYSEVIGNGTLDVKNILLLPSIPAAGAPNTPSNP